MVILVIEAVVAVVVAFNFAIAVLGVVAVNIVNVVAGLFKKTNICNLKFDSSSTHYFQPLLGLVLVS